MSFLIKIPLLSGSSCEIIIYLGFLSPALPISLAFAKNTSSRIERIVHIVETVSADERPWTGDSSSLNANVRFQDALPPLPVGVTFFPPLYTSNRILSPRDKTNASSSLFLLFLFTYRSYCMDHRSLSRLVDSELQILAPFLFVNSRKLYINLLYRFTRKQDCFFCNYIKNLELFFILFSKIVTNKIRIINLVFYSFLKKI